MRYIESDISDLFVSEVQGLLLSSYSNKNLILTTTNPAVTSLQNKEPVVLLDHTMLHVTHTALLGYGHTGARNDTTQQSGQTPDKEVEIKNITVCVSGYTETDTTGMLSPPALWRKQSEFVSSRQSGQILAAVGIRIRVSLQWGPPAWGLGEVLTTPLHKKTHVKNCP